MISRSIIEVYRWVRYAHSRLQFSFICIYFVVNKIDIDLCVFVCSRVVFSTGFLLWLLTIQWTSFNKKYSEGGANNE